jgi:tetratricopeptide (TPR) repeat protein
MNKKEIDVLYIHPSGNLTDYNIPMGVIGLMNSIGCAKAGKMYFEITDDIISNAKIIVMDCQWYFSLSEIGRLSKKFKTINPKAVIITGGYTATVFAESIVDRLKVDYVIKGDAEAPFPLLIQALLENKNVCDVPNVTGRGFAAPQSYRLTKEDYSNSDYINIDWFPALKQRMKTIHEYFPFCSNEALGLYPFIPVFKGCFYNCEFCYASKTSNFAFNKRGIVSRTPESVANDLLVCSKREDIKQVNIIADFIDILGAEFAGKIFSQKYDVNLSYCFNISNSLTINMLEKMLASFNRCYFQFIFSEFFHRNSEKKTYDYLAGIFEFLLKHGDKVKLAVYIARGNKTFDRLYAKLKKMNKHLIFFDHRSWFIDLPHPHKQSIGCAEEYFNTWVEKSRKAAFGHFTAKSDKEDNCKFYLALAAEYMSKGDSNKAVQYHIKALSVQPDNWAAYLSLAKTYFKLKRYEEAIDKVKQAIKLNHKNDKARLLLGFCYEKTKQYEKAIEEFKKAGKTERAKTQIRFSLFNCYRKIGRENCAYKELGKCLSIFKQKQQKVILTGK